MAAQHTMGRMRGANLFKPSAAVLPQASARAGLELTRAATAARFAPHTHDTWGIGVIDAGGHRSRSDRRQVEALAGSCIAVNPGEVHDGAPLGGGPRAWRMAYLQPATLQALAVDLGRTAPPPLPPVLADPALHAAFDALWQAAGGEALEVDTALLGLVRRLPLGRLPPFGRTHPGLQRCTERLMDFGQPAPALDELALLAGSSRWRVLRAFAAVHGLPPHAWLLQQRLAAARRALRHGRSLADAAALAGFADQSHMTRAFVRAFGYTPGTYARALGLPAATAFKTA